MGHPLTSARRKRFVRFLSAEEVVDMELKIQAGAVTGFTLNYRAHMRGSWQEVVRYDTAHGRPHLHRFWEGRVPRPWPHPASDLDAAFDWAEQDLSRPWRAYRALREASL